MAVSGSLYSSKGTKKGEEMILALFFIPIFKANAYPLNSQIFIIRFIKGVIPAKAGIQETYGVRPHE
jgi:hypothetical protein